jgi:hypothetical protein
MRTSGAERFYSASADEAYAALGHVLQGDSRFALKGNDAFAKSFSFSSGVSALTWGENFTAQVMPRVQGTVLRVEGTPKWSTVASRRRIRKLADRVLDGVSHYIQTGH